MLRPNYYQEELTQMYKTNMDIHHFIEPLVKDSRKWLKFFYRLAPIGCRLDLYLPFIFSIMHPHLAEITKEIHHYTWPAKKIDYPQLIFYWIWETLTRPRWIMKKKLHFKWLPTRFKWNYVQENLADMPEYIFFPFRRVFICQTIYSYSIPPV